VRLAFSNVTLVSRLLDATDYDAAVSINAPRLLISRQSYGNRRLPEDVRR
jgi:hypothetical protein